MVKPSILQIKPSTHESAECVTCGSKAASTHRLLFQGIHLLLECSCNECKTSFFQTVPIAHDVMFPISFSKDGLNLKFDKRAAVWLAEPLINSIVKKQTVEGLLIKSTSREATDEAILLNCLDDCFGHAYAKLLNAQFLIEAYPKSTLIILIAKNMQWMVPRQVSEVWTVEAKMSELAKHILNLNDFIHKEFNRFTKVYISTAKVWHDMDVIKDELFLKTKKFDILEFDTQPYQITFILRNDRYWHDNLIDEYLNKVFIKLKVSNYFRHYFQLRQNRLVKKTIRLLKKKNPEIQFTVTGIGKPYFANSIAQDLRSEKLDYETEIRWCNAYATSHIVIGVHGSNMLIPTSLSAGFIEILPDHKIPHMGEDTVLKYSGRNALLLGRHVTQCISPKSLTMHAIQMLRFGEIDKLVRSV